jgi:hypothetical protein
VSDEEAMSLGLQEKAAEFTQSGRRVYVPLPSLENRSPERISRTS